MKKSLLFLFIFISVFAKSQTPSTIYKVPSLSNLSTYFGNADRLYVVSVNQDYVTCNPCLTDSVAGAGGRKWKKLVAATAPITQTNGYLGIPQSSSSVNGFLSSTDWSTFNGKQATLVSGTNIKTINSTSLLGSGNISITATGGGDTLGYIYPERYGAVGDGVTNDYAAIQAAFNATPARGTVYFQPGKTYLCNSTLRRPLGPIRLLGGGGKYGNAVLKMTTANDTLISITVAEGPTLSQQDSASMIEYLRIEGPIGNSSGQGVYCFTSMQGHYFSIYGFYNAYEQGAGGYYGHFESCKFALAANAGFYSSSINNFNFSFSNCNFDSNIYGAFIQNSTSGGDGERLSFDAGCTIERNTTAGLFLDGMRAVNIQSCYFEQITDSASDIKIGANYTATDVTIQSCWFTKYPVVALWHIDINKATGVNIIGCSLPGSATGGGDIRGTTNTINVMLLNNAYVTLSGLSNSSNGSLNAGQLGIQTVTPSYSLQVGNGLGSTTRIIDLNASTNGYAEVSLSKASKQYWQLYDGPNTDVLSLMDSSNTDVFKFKKGGTVDILNGATIGSSYFSTASPSNGLIVQGNVGIGDASPASLLTVGSGDLFQVNSSGNIVKLNNVTTSFPASNGAGILTNDGSGNLTWGSTSGLTGSTGDMISFSGTNTVSNISAVGTGSLFASAGTGTLPVWTTTPSITTSLNVPLINGGGASNDDITIQGTSAATRTTSYVNLQPSGGLVGIGTSTPISKLTVIGSNTIGASIPTSGAGQPNLLTSGRFNVVNSNRTIYFDIATAPFAYAEFSNYKYDDASTFPMVFQANGG